MGSVLFDDDEQELSAGGSYAPQPAPEQAPAAESPVPDEEDFEPEYDEDGQEDDQEPESEAEQARQRDIMQDLVERLTGVVEKSPKNILTDDLIGRLRDELRTTDETVYRKFQESISMHLKELVATSLSTDLSAAELRRLWA